MINNKGISLITLTITIVVMLILASIAYTSSFESIYETKDTKIAVEKEKITEAVSKRMIDNARNSAAYPLVGRKVENIVEYAYYIKDMSNSELQKFVESVNGETVDYMRLLDSTSAASLGVTSVDKEHHYIVDYYSGSIYGVVDMAAYNAANP